MSTHERDTEQAPVYIVQGIDLYGRKFTGAYTQAEAEYLVDTDSLNKIIAIRKPA